MLPNFVIIGAARSGTSYLSTCLEEHPDIFMARLGYTGDIHFFNPHTRVLSEHHWEKGLAWYEGLFAGAAGETAVGEKSAYYLSDTDAPDNMLNTLGTDVKLLALLRNPVERAYSDYWYHIGEVGKGIDFVQACQGQADHLELVNNGLYGQHIHRWLQRFPKENLLCVSHEKLQSDPQTQIRAIFGFLGVEPDFVPPSIEQRINAAVVDRSAAARIRRAGGYIKRHYMPLFRILRRMPGVNALIQWMGSSQQTESETRRPGYPPLSAEDRSTVANLFRQDVQMLDQQLGTAFEQEWFPAPN